MFGKILKYVTAKLFFQISKDTKQDVQRQINKEQKLKRKLKLFKMAENVRKKKLQKLFPKMVDLKKTEPHLLLIVINKTSLTVTHI